mgnify:FL=1
MKKLKLRLQNIEGAEVLSREQLKKVMGGDFGGSGGPNCTSSCTSDSDCSGGDNSCKKCIALTIDVPGVGKKGDKVCQTS